MLNYVLFFIQILQSQDGTSFSNVFVNSPRFAHPLLRILIAREVGIWQIDKLLRWRIYLTKLEVVVYRVVINFRCYILYY